MDRVKSSATPSTPISLPSMEECEILLRKNAFEKNKDGTIDSRNKEFREVLQVVAGKEYPINKDGSPDMRCTSNPHIMRLKLDKMLKK